MTSLDEWHQRVTQIYGKRNLQSSPEQIFAHLQEQVGALSLIATDKTKASISFQSVLPKSIGWWMALCAKMRVTRVSDLIWIKFPGVCPYCLLSPHSAVECRIAKRNRSAPRWQSLFEIGTTNVAKKPLDLAAWQQMFFDIYPPSETDSFEVIYARLCEEMGELAEALRVAERSPQYFVSEAADVFAWLMKVQNLSDFRSVGAVGPGEELASWIQNMYGAGCQDCGNKICTCPPMSEMSVGRIGERLPQSIYRLFEFSLTTGPELSTLMSPPAETVTVDGLEIELTEQALAELAITVREVLRGVEVLRASDAQANASLQDIEMQLMWLQDSARVNEQLLTDLVVKISTLEPDTRDGLLGLFEATTSGVVAAALVELVRAAAGG